MATPSTLVLSNEDVKVGRYFLENFELMAGRGRGSRSPSWAAEATSPPALPQGHTSLGPR